jgi:hypothetical protein
MRDATCQCSRAHEGDAADVLYKGGPGDDDGGGVVGVGGSLWSLSVIEAAVISFVPVVGRSFDVMPCGRHWFVEHPRADRCGVGDDLDGSGLRPGQGA